VGILIGQNHKTKWFFKTNSQDISWLKTREKTTRPRSKTPWAFQMAWFSTKTKPFTMCTSHLSHTKMVILDEEPRVGCGVCALHPGKQNTMQLQVFAPYGLKWYENTIFTEYRNLV
jgi:hypothetical protein